MNPPFFNLAEITLSDAPRFRVHEWHPAALVKFVSERSFPKYGTVKNPLPVFTEVIVHFLRPLFQVKWMTTMIQLSQLLRVIWIDAPRHDIVQLVGSRNKLHFNRKVVVYEFVFIELLDKLFGTHPSKYCKGFPGLAADKLCQRRNIRCQI